MSLRTLTSNRWFVLAAKVGVSAVLLYLCVRNIDLASARAKLDAIDRPFALCALAICFAQIVLTSLRWHWIICFLGGRLSFLRTLWIVQVSAFFIQALPATVGGDAVRIFQAWQNGVSTERAVHSVLFDRLAGLTGLLLAGLLGVPFVTTLDGRSSVILGVIGLSGLLGLGAALALRRQWMPWLPRRVADLIRKFGDAGRELALSPAAWAWTLLPSIAIQLLSTLFIYVALRQFGVSVDFVECVLLVTLVMLIVSLPISIAGWGVREGALVVALGTIGIPSGDAAAASLLAGLAQLAVALPGGLLFLAGRPGSNASPKP